jgi:predicted DNA binding CopG/RHH family protein
MRGLQTFSPEYLEQSKRMSAEAVVRFLEDFRRLHGGKPKSRLISMKVPEPLLAAFKLRCRAEGVPYQTRIKTLMTAWLSGEDFRAHPPGAFKRKTVKP